MVSDFIILALFYKIFINYRYNYFSYINNDDKTSLYNPKFICGLEIYDIIEASLFMFAVGILQYLIREYVIFPDRGNYIYFQYMPFGYILYYFPLILICYILRTYNDYKNDYTSFLYWECFLYKGEQPKLFWDDPKYRKSSCLAIGKSEISYQAEKEKKCVLVFIVVWLCIMLIGQVSILFSVQSFNEKNIIISYDEYEYSDIIAIYKASKFKTLSGKIKDDNRTAIVFNDGRVSYYTDKNISEHAQKDFVNTISDKSGISIIECEFLPDDL